MKIWSWLLACVLAWSCASAQAEPVRLRLGLVHFGTASWEIDTMRTQALDRAAGLDIQVVDLASPEAGKIALLGGSVDMIVSDWLWVSHQRDLGHDISFLPYSSAVGAVMVGADSTIATISDLKGKRLGVAGGPLDKSWALLQALARLQGLDLVHEANVEFAAPPLLSQQLQNGNLDAVLTFWHYAARLKAKGFDTILSMDDAARALGLEGEPIWLGYVLTGVWDRAHPGAAQRFYAASRHAKDVLANDDGQWRRLRPMMAAEDDSTFQALIDGYRAGMPAAHNPDLPSQAAKLYHLLKQKGDGPATGTFHPAGL